MVLRPTTHAAYATMYARTPYTMLQARSRVDQLRKLGHSVDKVGHLRVLM